MTVEEIPGQAGDDELFYWFEIGVWFVWVEDLVAVHYCHKILSIGQVDDIVSISRQHVYSFYLVSAYLKVQHLVASDSALLDEAMAAYNDEEFPLCIVPVLSFCDAWLADINAYLATVQCMYEFSERASVVNVHLQWERYFLFWKIAQVRAIQLLSKRVLWDLWDHEGLWLVCEAVDQVYDFAKSDFVGYGAVAVRLPVGAGNDGMVGAGNDERYYVEAIVGATVFVALKSINHFINEVVDVEKFHLYRTVVDLDREVVGYVVAEGCYCRVVVRTAPLTKEIRETVYEDFCSSLLAIFKHQFLTCLLAFSILTVAETACESCLD